MTKRCDNVFFIVKITEWRHIIPYTYYTLLTTLRFDCYIASSHPSGYFLSADIKFQSLVYCPYSITISSEHHRRANHAFGPLFHHLIIAIAPYSVSPSLELVSQSVSHPPPPSQLHVESKASQKYAHHEGGGRRGIICAVPGTRGSSKTTAAAAAAAAAQYE